MRHNTKRLVAVLTCCAMVFGFTVNSFAGQGAGREAFNARLAAGLERTLNKAAEGLMNVVAALVPNAVTVQKLDRYAPGTEFKGDETFLDAPANRGMWRLGYASDSIVPADFAEGKYYKGGYALDKITKELLDDLRVRVVSLDDSSGRGAVIFAVVDCIGLANADVQRIRAALKPFAKENGIKSINVSATHTHSGIDTQGVYTNIVKSVLRNIGASMVRSDKLAPAISEDFLNLIVEKTAACAKQAFAAMEPGMLTYAKADLSDYTRDRTAPFCYDGNMYRLLFAPANKSSRPTIIASLGVHPEGVGFEQDAASADFIYYMDQLMREKGYNLLFMQGALGTVTEDMYLSSDEITETRTESVVRYGQELGYIAIGMTMDEAARKALTDKEWEQAGVAGGAYTPWYEGLAVSQEQTLPPILNIRTEELLVKIDCPVYKALGKLALANNAIYRDGLFDYYSATEIGYMELGGVVKAVLCPGETYGELIYGGEKMAGLPFGPLHEEMGTEDVMVLDLMNDAIGYIMPDDDFVYFHVDPTEDFVEFTGAWGMTSVGRHAASQVYGAVNELYDSIR